MVDKRTGAEMVYEDYEYCPWKRDRKSIEKFLEKESKKCVPENNECGVYMTGYEILEKEVDDTVSLNGKLKVISDRYDWNFFVGDSDIRDFISNNGLDGLKLKVTFEIIN